MSFKNYLIIKNEHFSSIQVFGDNVINDVIDNFSQFAFLNKTSYTIYELIIEGNFVHQRRFADILVNGGVIRY